MRASRRTAAALIAAFVVSSLVVATPSGASDGPRPAEGVDGLSAVDAGVVQTDTVGGVKSVTGRLAQSDPALLDRTDTTPVDVIVKLDYDAAANYAGDVAGLPATSPRITGKKLSTTSAAEQEYSSYTTGMDAGFRAQAAQLPGAELGRSLTTVYGGVVMRLPANEVGSLLDIPDVAAVQADTMNQPLTDSSTYFIGAPTLWAQAKNGKQSLAGQGVIFADIDTGIWPEHPSFADNPALGNPPPSSNGQPRTCDFGDNPLTPAMDVFKCNHKLIGGQSFIDPDDPGAGLYPDSARDSDGHGTHTASTAAGNVVTNAPIFGVDRGPISGVAPGAWVLEYKICGIDGCSTAAALAAIQQAILDGADVINYSISGGSSPFTDPVELAFLGAYEAGITVAASAGNSGPGAATTDHHSPWVITVAASTQSRAFESTLTVTDGGASTTFTGASITAGVPTDTPIVMAQNLPGATDALCAAPLPAGSVTGKIVACARGVNARVEKGYNVLQGGAVGMILYNPNLADVETDNHWLPAVHLADGTQFLAFMTAHPAATARFTAGVKAEEQGDVMAAFSSRGPGGLFLKPDITAPGVQILAGNTPRHDEITTGPPDEYYQAIAGTSMSAPHIAGSAILLRSLHPTWGPGAIKSALMTTAETDVVKEDLVTPADPFDDGAGRVDLTVAGATPIVFQDSATNMAALGNDPLTAMQVNIPSINLPTMPGSVTVERTATNVSKKAYAFEASATAPDGSTITVAPKSGKIKAGASKTFSITITSNAPDGQYFGQIDFTSAGNPDLHMPVAFNNQQGDIAVSQECADGSIQRRDTTECTVTATNNSFGTAAIVAQTKVSSELKIIDSSGATHDLRGKSASPGPVTLDGQSDAKVAIAPGETPVGGYLDLAQFGIQPATLDNDDDAAANYNVPAFQYGGRTYTRIGVVSNGYVVVGGADTSADIAATPQQLPNPAAPNNVLAAYWTDLYHVTVRAGVLTDGVDDWIIAQIDGDIFTTTLHKSMQVWINVGPTEGISYGYTDATIASSDANGQPVVVGAENASGTSGAQLPGLPKSGYVVSTTPGAPGESYSYTVTVLGKQVGTGVLTTTLLSDVVAGTTIVRTNLGVT